MSDLEPDGGGFIGGCQCGAVRFRASMPPSDVSFCHCRMCQRAVGNLFAAFAMFRKDSVAWTKGEPAVFESSSAAERGFCRRCGTPLFFRYKASPEVELTIGSFDHPEALTPRRHYGIESRVPWHVIDDALPQEETNADSPYLKGVRLYQDPAGAD
jgi:hypothetical protein